MKQSGFEFCELRTVRCKVIRLGLCVDTCQKGLKRMHDDSKDVNVDVNNLLHSVHNVHIKVIGHMRMLSSS